MTDGEQQLPADDELFEQLEQPVVAEPVAEPMQVDEHNHGQELQAENEEQMDTDQVRIPGILEPAEEIRPAEDIHPEPEPIHEQQDQIPFLDGAYDNDPHDNSYYEQEEVPPPLPAGPHFQPTAYVPPISGGSQHGDSSGAEGSPDGRDLRNDANENTVWIDSDSDDDTEDIILRQNFYLPYSDHNYDCPDPADRVEHPQEGPFPVIEGLDENGRITKQWMPDGSGNPPASPPAEPSNSPSQISLHGVPRRSVMAAQPFSIGGTPIEYAQHRQTLSGRGDGPQFRFQNDGFNGNMRGGIIRGTPAAILRAAGRDGGQPLYQQNSQLTMGSPRGVNVIPQRRSGPQQPQNATPGSYQHIQHPTPGGAGIRRANLGGSATRILPGGVRQGPVVRPINVIRPLEHEREFIDQPQHGPAPVPPITRRIADVAPHRMTPEQREQMVARGRAQPVAHFPIIESQPGMTPQIRGIARNVLVRGQGSPSVQGVAGAGVLVRGRGPEGLRSPQRQLDQPLNQHGDINTSPSKFQLKVTTTSTSYSSVAPPKISEQLPAQITEDPPEDEPTTSSTGEQTAQPSESVADLGAPNIAQPVEEPIRHVSPIKPHGVSKPTPPHRLPQDEKTAHLARIMADKEKPVVQPVQPLAAQIDTVPSIPVRNAHQDDTLAMVQSVFDPSKPRLPDTPKDKEAIAKIADHLKFSAEEYEIVSGNKTPNPHVDPHRRRIDSGMSGSSQQHYHPPHHPGMMDMDVARRKRLSSGSRYDIPMNQQQAAVPLRSQQSMMDPPHRARGRPKGSTGPQRTRYPSGQEPIPPHRVGGARTLPPRNQQPPAQKNSDSEGSGINQDDESWEMRCRCGMTHSEGSTIECEKCKTWQHTQCMDISADGYDGYECDRCDPSRTISISKSEAVKIQKKELAMIKKLTEQAKKNKNKRKSEPVPVETKKPSTSNSRKSLPNTFERHQLNDYSKAAAALLSTLAMTTGADTLLQESAEMKRARRMYVSENTEALVTTLMINQRAVVLELNGHVSMANEVKRTPGGGGYMFMYDGLMKGTTGEDMGNGQELICVDTRRKGNDSKFTRRSCEPNCVLKHVLGSNATLGVMIVATKDIPYNQEITLPFDMDWKNCDQPLECADHVHNMDDCPFETQRKQYAAERHSLKRAREETQRRKAEEERRNREEARRLEEEVRQERAAMQKQMEEEEERLENERKAKEREEARRKKKEAKEAKEAEKREREAREASAAGSQPPATPTTPAANSRAGSAEQPRSSREERALKQAEELFRRQDEEEKRKKAKAIQKADREKSVEATSRKSVSDAKDVPGTSAVTSSRRSGRRMDSVVSERTASPPVKRPRGATVNVLGRSSEKRAGQGTAAPTPKRPKQENIEQESGVTCKELQDALHENAVVATAERIQFVLPYERTSPPSEWAQKLFDQDRSKDDEALAIRKKKVEKMRKRESKNSSGNKKSAEKKEEKVKKTDDKKEEKKVEKKAEKTSEQKEKKEEKSVTAPALPVQKVPTSLKRVEEIKQEIKVENETSSVEKEITSSEERQEPEGDEDVKSEKEEKVKGPKKLSLSDYKKRKELSGPSSSTPAAAVRQGFIPSTEGSSNVELSAIPLDIAGASSSAPPPPPPPAEVEDDQPHTQSLAERAASVLEFLKPSGPPAPPAPQQSSRNPTTPSSSRRSHETSTRSHNRPSRWHN